MADRYWVGGTGAWSNVSTANWSTATGLSFTASRTLTTLTTVGSPALVVGMTVWGSTHTNLGTIVSGSGNTWVMNTSGTVTSQSMSAATVGASVPTAADSVFFDANSNSSTTAFTVTMSVTPRVCNDFLASGLDGTMTLAGSGIGLTVSGSLTFQVTNFTRTYTGTTTFNATSTGKTITTNGSTLSGVTFDGVGGGWTLGSALTATSQTITVTNGTFDTSSSGNYAISCNQIASSNSNIRTINLNASTITLSSNAAVTFTTSTNLTFNAGTSLITCVNSSAIINGGGQTFYNVSFTSTALSAPSISGINTFNNLFITGRTTVGLSSFGFRISADQTINGTFTISAGTASAYRTQLVSSSAGTTRTLTCAAVSFTDTDFKDITIAGAAAPASGTRLGDAKNNSGITFDAAKTVYFRQTGSADWGATGSGSWSATSGGALDATMFPLPQDTAVFPAAIYPASGSTTTVNSDYNISTVDMSLRTSNTMTLATGTIAPFIYGNWINGTGITISGTGTFTFAGRTTQTITSAGKAFTQPITINSPSGSVTLQDAFTTSATNTTTLTSGTLDLQSYTLSTGLFSSTNTNTRTIAFGTGQISCTGTGTVWTTSGISGLTTTGTQVVNVTSTGSTAITVTPGALSEANSISFNFTGGTYALTFLASSSNSARNVNFTGYAGTLGTMGGSFIYGNLTLSAGMTLTAFATALSFGATSGTQQITTNAKTIDFPLTFNGVGGTFRLEDALTMGSTRTATLTNGTLNLNNFTLSTGLFNSTNSNTRTIAFGTGQISCTGTGIVWTTQNAAALTTTGTPVVNVTSTGSTAISVNPGVLSEANSISFNFTGGTYALVFFTGTAAVRNVDFTGYAGTLSAITSAIIYGNLKLSTGMTLTASANTMRFEATSGTQTITSNAKTMDFPIGIGGSSLTTVTCADALTLGSTRALTFLYGTLKLAAGTTSTVGSFVTATTTLKYLQSTTPGTQATISDASGTNTVTYLSIQDSAATGGATWDATSATNVDGGNNTGWIFGGVIYAAVIAETATATDAFLSLAAFLSVLAETATATDSVLSFAAFYAALAETATATDSVLSLAAFNSALAETATATDTPGVAASTFNAPVAETATATDSVIGLADFYASLSEAATATDSGVGFILFPASIAETATATDAVLSFAAFYAALAETATATDSPLVAPSTFNAPVAEIATATDSPLVAPSTFNAPVSETVTISDLVLGAYLWNLIDDSQSDTWQNVNNSSGTSWSQVANSQSDTWQNISNPQTPGWGDVPDAQTPVWE